MVRGALHGVTFGDRLRKGPPGATSHRRRMVGRKEIWFFWRTNLRAVRHTTTRRDAASREHETPNLPITMYRSCHLTKLERLAGLCRWCDRLVVRLERSGHDPG